MLIREARPEDLRATLEVERAAFDSDVEPALVEALLSDPSAQPSLSLLAWKDERCVGHVLFTAVSLVGSSVPASLLAPLAVHPKEQRKGIGLELMKHGLARLRESGVQLVFVLGDPAYYRRAGFEPALALGFEPPQAVPPEHLDAWMVLLLTTSALGTESGQAARAQVRCASALDSPEFWS